MSYYKLNKGLVPYDDYVTTASDRRGESNQELYNKDDEEDNEKSVIHLQSYTRKYDITPPDKYMFDPMYRIETKNPSKKCYIDFFLGGNEIFLNKMYCQIRRKGSGRRMLLDLLNFLTDNRYYKDDHKVSLKADSRVGSQTTYIIVKEQENLVGYYAKLGFHPADENYENYTEINYPKSFERPHPMISTIGEIKAAILNYGISGGKTKSKRNKSRRRRVLRKSRRQIKKRN